MCLRGNDKPVDDGLVGVSVEGMSGDGATDRLRGHPPKGKEMVGNSGVSSNRYWSMGSRSKESRYSGVWAKDGWLQWGELFKRHIDESRGSRPSICRQGWGFGRGIARVIRHSLVGVVKGAVVEFTVPAMVKDVFGVKLIAETEDAVSVRFRGVKVVLGVFEWGEVFDGEVLWEAFNREVGKIVGHLMGF